MVENDARPLTDDERAELEALRAEKARREEAERARRERAELEALRAERAAASDTGSTGVEPSDPAARTFGQRMVLSDTEDADGVPTMPPAQKIIIGVCLVAVIGFIIYMAITGGA